MALRNKWDTLQNERIELDREIAATTGASAAGVGHLIDSPSQHDEVLLEVSEDLAAGVGGEEALHEVSLERDGDSTSGEHVGETAEGVEGEGEGVGEGEGEGEGEAVR